ncbi:MAG: alpha/beta hydrolase fold domain-containing protein [Nevskiales bacterium]
MIRLVIRFSIFVLLSGCATHSGAPEAKPPAAVHTGYELERDIVYSPAGWPETLLADVYRPKANGLQPGILLIHGGGWEAPDRRGQMDSIAERLAERGYVVMNATYRFAPQYLYPAAVDDLREALKWLRQHAAEYGIRTDRVGVFGYSAGGHLAALLAVQNPRSSLRVQAAVIGGAPTDLRKYAGGKLVPQFLGGTQTEKPALYGKASPITYVTPDDPPVFIYHGGSDTLVSPDHAQDFKVALDKAGIKNELYILRGRGHVTAFLTDRGAVSAALEFLDRNLR